jgi:lysophospholipase L1-like esterase
MSVSGAFPLRRCAAHAHHRRFLVALVAVCLALVAGCGGNSGGSAQAASSSSSSSASAARGTYLALGDSVPFGYRGRPAGIDYSRATNFTGYPELVGEDLGLTVLNAACPGETSASFLDPKAQSLGCENTPTAPAGFRTLYPLHVQYASPDQSQLDYAVQTLRSTKDVRLVTLMVGANDAFICQQTTADKCVSEVGTVAQTVGGNVGKVLTSLRQDAGYTGKIAVVTYYALDYSDSSTALGTQVLNSAIGQAAQAAQATVVSGFDAFRPVAEQSGGNSTAAGLVRPDDVHPTDKGQQLLAQAVEAAVGR